MQTSRYILMSLAKSRLKRTNIDTVKNLQSINFAMVLMNTLYGSESLELPISKGYDFKIVEGDPDSRYPARFELWKESKITGKRGVDRH